MSALTVWVVDDNPMNLMLLRDLLELRGHRVLSALSAAEVERLADGAPPPDVAILDIMLPDVDGVRLLHRLRARDRYGDVPFLAVTAHAMSGDRERLLAAGFAGYLPKPIDTRRFVDEVERVAGGGRAADRVTTGTGTDR